MEQAFTDIMLLRYAQKLTAEDTSPGTINKYLRDLRRLQAFLTERQTECLTKDDLISYKEELAAHYAVTTANSMLAAVNGFLEFIGRPELKVKAIKTQKKIFREKEWELTAKDYRRLLETARETHNDRLFYLMQTLASTGIRISELPFITAEALRKGRATVNCKGKSRIVVLPGKLRKSLEQYCKSRRIKNGSIFISRNGKPLSRTNIWAELKKLCRKAKVDPKKVFPHNFRHFFATCFYKLEKDIAKLADLLGHASIETTRIYVMESSDNYIRQIERLHLIL